MSVKPQEPSREAGPEADAEGRPTGFPHVLTRGFRSLAVRNYRLFWVGQLISVIGRWMQMTAQAWLVLLITNSAFALGLVTTLQFLPMTLLSLVGGVITDRIPKQRLLLITQSAALIQAAIFGTLVATGIIQLWHVYVLATLQGIINAIDTPVRQAFVIELVGREHIMNAVALNSMLFNGARIIGPAVAGLLIAQIGIAPVLYLNAITYCAVLAGLLLMDPDAFYEAGRRPEAGTLRQRLAEGLQYAWHTPRVRLILIVVAAIGTFGYNFSLVLPLLAGFVLHTDAAEFGGLTAFLGLGAFAAAILTAYTRQVTLKRLLIGSGSFALILAAVALSTHYVLSAVLLVALGFAGITFATSANTLLQLHAPDELRGRIMSLYVLLFAGSTPIGGLFIGTFSDIIGVSATLLLCALICLLGVGYAARYGLQQRHS